MILMKRSLVYCVGLFIMALGVSCSVWSNLGVSPMSAIPYVLNRIIPVVSMGTFTSALFCCYILLQAILLGKAFRMFRLLQIVGTFLFGWFVDCTNRILSAVLTAPHSYPVQLCFLGLGIVCVAIGIFFYITPGMPMLPGEGVMQVISEKYHIPLHWAKIGFDVVATVLALVLCLFPPAQRDSGGNHTGCPRRGQVPGGMPQAVAEALERLCGAGVRLNGSCPGFFRAETAWYSFRRRPPAGCGDFFTCAAGWDGTLQAGKLVIE